MVSAGRERSPACTTPTIIDDKWTGRCAAVVLKRYDIRTTKTNGSRVCRMPVRKVIDIESRYGFNAKSESNYFCETTNMAPQSTSGSSPPLNSTRPLTKKEVAKFFSVSQRTIDRGGSESILPADAKLTIGGTVCFNPRVLEAYVNQSAIEKGGNE